MSEEYTPGPWTVTTCNEGESCWCRIIACPATEGSDGNDWVIASGAVHKRDANLIAAAPDLYEALDLLTAPKCAGVDECMARDKAFDALAKARGDA